MDNELLLFDRIEVIKATNQKFDLEHNAYLSFSGGKDSTLLHYLLDMALPNNQIPRVFINTGIEYKMVADFVKEMASKDSRFVIVQPTQAIKPMLEKHGYPFKSKEYSQKLNQWHKGHRDVKYVADYLTKEHFGCPKQLRYQFSDDFTLNISAECCKQLKKKPARKWEHENKRPIVMTGMRSGEKGQRASIKGCILTDKKGNVTRFHPLIKVDENWENWFLEKLETDRGGQILCQLYYPPYNFQRTGCKGCPYALDLQAQLEIMELYLPNERKQCEMIWEPVYQEYRKIGYRLKKMEGVKLF